MSTLCRSGQPRYGGGRCSLPKANHRREGLLDWAVVDETWPTLCWCYGSQYTLQWIHKMMCSKCGSRYNLYLCGPGPGLPHCPDVLVEMFCTLDIPFLKSMTMVFHKLSKMSAYPVVVFFSSQNLLTEKHFPSGSIRSMRLAGVWEWSCCEICLYHWSYNSWFTAASFLIVTPKKSATLYWSSSVEESRSFTSRDGGWTCSRMGSWLSLTCWLACGRAWFCTTSCRFWLWCWRDMMNSWLLGWAA